MAQFLSFRFGFTLPLRIGFPFSGHHRTHAFMNEDIYPTLQNRKLMLRVGPTSSRHSVVVRPILGPSAVLRSYKHDSE